MDNIVKNNENACILHPRVKKI